eukprot:gene2525-3271_t
MSSLKRKLDDSPLHSWECQLCGRPATSACKGCGAFYYCRPKHQALHWKLHHHSECDRLKCQMRQSETLQQFPFTFTRETTAKSRGRSVGNPFDDLVRLGSSELLDTSPGFEGAPPGIADWEAYYRLRQLPLDSPVALVLDVALTLYHVLCTSFKQQFAEAFLSKSLLPLTVHDLFAAFETPFFITDFCEEAALLAVEILTAAGVELDYQISPNPFRRPFSKRSNDNALPAYSNGFLFGRTNRQSKQDDCSKSNGVSPVEQGVS